MTQGILLALLAATVYGFLGVAFELAAKRNYPNWDFALYKQLFGTILGLLFVFWLKLPLYENRILAIALAGAVCYVATLWAYLTASRERDIAANWTILNLSVALPVLLSVFWFNDRFTSAKVFGVVLTIASVIFIGEIGTQRIEFTMKWVRWITVAFLLNGWFVVLLRFVPEGLGALFTVYFYGISVVVVLVYKLISRERLAHGKGILAVAALGACTHWSGIMLTILALEVVGKISKQAGLIVYPITNGLVIPIGVVIGSLILRQKITTRSRWGIGCGAIAMVFLSWG